MMEFTLFLLAYLPAGPDSRALRGTGKTVDAFQQLTAVGLTIATRE